MNSVFNLLNGNLMNQVQQLRQNPMQFFMRHKMNIPQEYANDPEGAVQHMVDSGQVTPEQVEYAKRYAQRMGLKL